MGELVSLKLGILMWIVHVLTQSAFAGGSLGLDYLSGTRDQPREPRGMLYPRATRALRNYIENFVPFVAADLGLIVTNHTGGWGAGLWILCRIVYLPLYLTGASPWRTVAWGLSFLGLIMMLWRLA
jgi:uncharacterized MAPEG superfamily protein